MEEQQATQKKGMNPLIIGAVVVLLLAGGGWLALSQNNTQPTQQSPTEREQMTEKTQQPTGAMMEESPLSPASEDGEIKEITVEGKNFSYTPAQITVKKGDKVKITFKNSGGSHDWTLDYNGKTLATKIIQSDQTDTVEFVADTVGTFDYYCSVGNHREMGMEGKLIVQ